MTTLSAYAHARSVHQHSPEYRMQHKTPKLRNIETAKYQPIRPRAGDQGANPKKKYIAKGKKAFSAGIQYPIHPTRVYQKSIHVIPGNLPLLDMILLLFCSGHRNSSVRQEGLLCLDQIKTRRTPTILFNYINCWTLTSRRLLFRTYHH